MLGQLDELGQEAAEVAMTFISINIRNIRAWLSGQPPIDEPLQSQSTDVTVAMGSVGHSKEGPSAAACQVQLYDVHACPLVGSMIKLGSLSLDILVVLDTVE